jgi:hypothetical protein
MFEMLWNIFTIAMFALGCLTTLCGVLVFALYWFNFAGLKHED